MKKISKLAVILVFANFSFSCGLSVIDVVTPQPAFSPNPAFFSNTEFAAEQNMLRPKEDLALAAVSGTVYAIGGDVNNAWLSDNETYSNRTWVKVTPMSEQRSGHAVTVNENKIFVTGGFNGIKWLSTLEVYDTVTDKWEIKAPMPSERSGLGLAAVNGKIYAVGGNLTRNNWLNRLEVYDPAANTWSSLNPMAVPRTEVTAAAVGEKIYVFGGENESGVVNTVEEYDVKRNRWRTKTAMPTARTNMEAVVAGHNIFVIGGRTHDNKPLDVVEVYNADTDKWTTGVKLDVPVYAHGAAIMDNKIYIAGGVSPSGITDRFVSSGVIIE